MKFCESENLIGALVTELAVDTLWSGLFLNITDCNNILCDGDDWRNVVLPILIGSDFVGTIRIDRSTDDALFGRVKIFRIEDLAWENENPNSDVHRAIAYAEFLLPREFKITEENLFACSRGLANDKFALQLLGDLIIQTKGRSLIAG